MAHGIKKIISEVGQVNYSIGVITLNNFSPYDINNSLGELQISVIPKEQIIQSTKNKVLILDVYDKNSVKLTLKPL